MSTDDDPSLLDLVNARRMAQGARDLHEILVERLAEEERRVGLTPRLLDAWDRLGRLRLYRAVELHELENGWSDRTELAQQVGFGLGYELGLAEAGVAADEDLTEHVREVALAVAQLLAEHNVSEECALLGLLGALRARVLAARPDSDG